MMFLPCFFREIPRYDMDLDQLKEAKVSCRCTTLIRQDLSLGVALMLRLILSQIGYVGLQMWHMYIIIIVHNKVQAKMPR